MVCVCHRFKLKRLNKPAMFFPCTEYGYVQTELKRGVLAACLAAQKSLVGQGHN